MQRSWTPAAPAPLKCPLEGGGCVQTSQVRSDRSVYRLVRNVLLATKKTSLTRRIVHKNVARKAHFVRKNVPYKAVRFDRNQAVQGRQGRDEVPRGDGVAKEREAGNPIMQFPVALRALLRAAILPTRGDG